MAFIRFSNSVLSGACARAGGEYVNHNNPATAVRNSNLTNPSLVPMEEKNNCPDSNRGSGQTCVSMEELGGRGSGRSLRQQNLVRCVLVGERRQPDCRKHRRRARHHRGLQEGKPDMAQSTAMLGRMMMIVFEGSRGELRASYRAQHQDDQ